MDLENQTKESPLEKAKRLKAEKESKDQAKMEAEAKKQAEDQAMAEKMNALNSQKQELENQLNEVDIKIETSRSEAHETRDTMKEGGLDQDEEFKGEYQATVSEVAGNLNELRNERNRIKSELEKINSNIENFEVNEVIDEGKEATQEAVENVNEENEEAVAQVESYPGADAQDVEGAKEIADETSKEVGVVVENAKKDVDEVLKNANDEALKELEDFNSFARTLSKELFPNPKNQLLEFMNQKYKELNPGSEEYNSKISEIATTFNYRSFVGESQYIKEYQPNLSLEDYKINIKKLKSKESLFLVIEKIKKQSDNQKKEDSQTVDLEFKNKQHRDKVVEEFKKTGKGIDRHYINLLFENGFLSVNEIAQGLANNEQDLAKNLQFLSPGIIEKLKDEEFLRDGQEVKFNKYLENAYSTERKLFDDTLHNDKKYYEEQIDDFAKASNLLLLFKATGKRFDDEFKKLWNEKFTIIKNGLMEKEYFSDYFRNHVNLKSAISTDGRVLKDIVLPGLKKDLNNQYGIDSAVKALEDLVNNNLVSREEANEMYKEALI